MSVTRDDVLAIARVLAQESSATPLLHAASDYTPAFALALRIFDGDVPNTRVVHHTVTGATFRFVLAGAGAILTGLDAWVQRHSALREVWHPYDTAAQGQTPLDRNTWRVVEEPGLTVLELLEYTPSNGVLRLEFTRPHVVDASNAALSSILPGDVEALQTITAVKLLDLYAIRSIQNTGSTGVPSDVVDRRSPSDQARARAKELFATYQALVGRRSSEDLRAASAIGELDVDTSHPHGFLWHPRGSR